MDALRLNSQCFPPTPAELDEFSGAGVHVYQVESVDDLAVDHLGSIDALLVISAKVRAETIDKLEKCRVIVRYGSGTDNVDVGHATQKGIVVANAPDFCVSEVADHTMALLLATARKLRLMDRYTRTGRWQARVEEKVARIAGKTLGLVGFGRIAQQVARRARSFDLNVVANDTNFDRTRAHSLEVTEVCVEDLLRQSHFVSLHAPLTPQTFHMIGDKELRMMKPESILINTGRGGLVDETALAEALSQGWIAGAGIDVYEHLPMFDPHASFVPHPLFNLDNVTLSPHSAASSVESLEQLMLDGAREAIRVLNGMPPRNWVNPAVAPRVPMQSVGQFE